MEVKELFIFCNTVQEACDKFDTTFNTILDICDSYECYNYIIARMYSIKIGNVRLYVFEWLKED